MSLSAADSATAEPRAPIAWIWIGAFFVAATLYIATADRGPQWQDSGWQQWRILTGTLAHPHGLALTHPLHFWLGRAALKLLPWLEPAFAITLVSCISGAIAIANIAATVLVLTSNRIAATISATALLLSHTFWQHCTHTESYGLVLALLSVEWLCLAQYCRTRRAGWLLGMALANGLGIANHMLAALSTPVILVLLAMLFHVKQLRGRDLAVAMGFWVAGALPYSAYVIVTAVATGDLGGAVHSALFGTYARHVLTVMPEPRVLALAAGFLLYNLCGLTIPLALHALVGKSDAPRLFRRAALAWLIVYAVFAARYVVADQYSFLFPVYALLALFAGMGLADIQRRWQPALANTVVLVAAVTALWTPFVYWATCRVLSQRHALPDLFGNKPYRDGYRALLVPWSSGPDYVVLTNRAAFAQAGRDGTIFVGDSMMEHAVRYEQFVGRAPTDVEVVVQQVGAFWEPEARQRERMEQSLRDGRPLVLVPRDRDWPETLVEDAQWRRVGDVFVLSGLGPATSRTASQPAENDSSP